MTIYNLDSCQSVASIYFGSLAVAVGHHFDYFRCNYWCCRSNCLVDLTLHHIRWATLDVVIDRKQLIELFGLVEVLAVVYFVAVDILMLASVDRALQFVVMHAAQRFDAVVYN